MYIHMFLKHNKNALHIDSLQIRRKCICKVWSQNEKYNVQNIAELITLITITCIEWKEKYELVCDEPWACKLCAKLYQQDDNTR